MRSRRLAFSFQSGPLSVKNTQSIDLKLLARAFSRVQGGPSPAELPGVFPHQVSPLSADVPLCVDLAPTVRPHWAQRPPYLTALFKGVARFLFFIFRESVPRSLTPSIRSASQRPLLPPHSALFRLSPR